ncbi:MAG TPA: SHOCT domain-containing protein, partial [Acidimicrobiia bacterium]|nr:SHOCT domain-containing protein [Acidimicrobiia bacterium]
MAALVLGVVAVATVVLSFAFAALALTLARHSAPPASPPAPASAPVEATATESMSGFIAEIERLAALRERGALTDKEFATQKAKVLAGG